MFGHVNSIALLHLQGYLADPGAAAVSLQLGEELISALAAPLPSDPPTPGPSPYLSTDPTSPGGGSGPPAGIRGPDASAAVVAGEGAPLSPTAAGAAGHSAAYMTPPPPGGGHAQRKLAVGGVASPQSRTGILKRHCELDLHHLTLPLAPRGPPQFERAHAVYLNTPS